MKNPTPSRREPARAIRLSEEVYDRFRNYARLLNLTQNDVLQKLLDESKAPKIIKQIENPDQEKLDI
jgi:cytoskeletal protein RodZ